MVILVARAQFSMERLFNFVLSKCARSRYELPLYSMYSNFWSLDVLFVLRMSLRYARKSGWFLCRYGVAIAIFERFLLEWRGEASRGSGSRFGLIRPREKYLMTVGSRGAAMALRGFHRTGAVSSRTGCRTDRP